MGNHVIFCNYVQIERVGLFVIISLMLNEFSYGKMQILHHVSSKPLSKRCFYGGCIFPLILEQRLKVFAQGCVENYSA